MRNSHLLIRPRLTDYHGILLPQSELDFAIPFFDEDIPLYLDPFMLWRSPSHQDQALHTSLINAFNNLGYLANQGKEDKAITILIAASECDEIGLGSSATRQGKRIGRKKRRKFLRCSNASSITQAEVFDILKRYNSISTAFLKIALATSAAALLSPS